MNTRAWTRLMWKRWFPDRPRGSPSAPMARLLAPWAALLVGLAVAACGGGSAQSGGPASDAASPAQGIGEERLWIKDQGQTIPFQNGASVTVGATSVEIYVSPYPPTRTANMDFYLTRDGSPVESATVTLQYDMTVMEHGPFRLLAAPMGRGHYLAPMEFSMSGDFWLNVSVDGGSGESVINMYVRAVR